MVSHHQKGAIYMTDSGKLRQQIVDILQRNDDADFLRRALMKVATLEQVWHEQKEERLFPKWK